MTENEYKIIDDFQIKDVRVLVLDRDYKYGGFEKAVVDGKIYSYTLNSIWNWVLIKSTDSFKGKQISFISDTLKKTA